MENPEHQPFFGPPKAFLALGAFLVLYVGFFLVSKYISGHLF